MAENTDALLRELRNLTSTLTNMSGVMAQQNDTASDGTRQGQLSSRGSDGADILASVAKATKKAQKEIAESGVDLSDAMKSMADYNRHLNASGQEQLESLRAEMKLSRDVDVVSEQMFKKHGIRITNLARAEANLEDQVNKSHDAFDASTEAMQANKRTVAEHTAEFAKNHRKAAIFWTMLKQAGGETYRIAVAQAATGVQATKEQAIAAAELGMAHDELIRETATFKQTMGAAGMGTNDFTTLMQDNAREMVAHTGSMKAGALLAAEAGSIYKLSGGEGAAGMREFVKETNDQYKKFQDMTGGTAEEFTQLNSALRNSATSQAMMFKMNKTQRLQYQQEMQQRRNLLINDGLRADQAQAVVEAMSNAQAAPAKERLKNAAKLQASLGAMGMGAMGKEAADILRKGSRASATETARLTEIMKMANQEAGRRGGGSIRSEMIQDHLNGLNPLMGGDSPLVAAVTQLTNAMNREGSANPEKENSFFDKSVDEIIRAGDAIKGTQQSGYVQAIGTAIGAAAGTAISGLFAAPGAVIGGAKAGFGMMLGTMSSLSSMMMKGAGLVWNFLNPISKMIAAFGIGFSLGTVLNKALDALFPTGDLIGRTVAFFVDGIVGIYDSVGNFVKDIPKMVGDGFTNSLGTVGNFFVNLGDIFKVGFEYMKEKAMGIFSDTKDAAEAAKGTLDLMLSKSPTQLVSEALDYYIPSGPKNNVGAEIQAKAAAMQPTPEERKKLADATAANNAKVEEWTKQLVELGKEQLAGLKAHIELVRKQNEQQKEDAEKVTDAIGKQPMVSR